MYWVTAPGRVYLPGKWVSESKWEGKEGWTLQPFVPPTVSTQVCIAGRNHVWIGKTGSTEDLIHRTAFKSVDTRLGNEYLIGTMVRGHGRKHRSGKVIVHDMVSDAPLRERIERMLEVTKNNHVFEVSLPAQPGLTRGIDQARLGWPLVGWLIKKDNAPVRLNRKKTLERSTTTLELNHYQL